MDPSGRHSRHELFASIGPEGQRKIESACIAVVGCGALGSRSAELLARAGVGRRKPGLLRIIDRDTVDLSNLQRQALFDSADAAESRPKATAAARHIAAIDPEVRCEPHVRDLSPSNAERLLEGADLVIDGTDNFRTRFLVNDVALLRGTPWIYGGAVASSGIVGGILPGRGPCFRCLVERIPSLGSGPTCDSAGIITPLPSAVAALQVSFAIRWIVSGEMPPGIHAFDLWSDRPFRDVLFATAEPDPDCRSCGRREWPALREETQELVTLCGRNSVQVVPERSSDLESAAARLRGVATAIHRHPQSVTASIAEGRLTLFADGRILVEGTTDPLVATSLIARYLGG